MSRYEGWDRDAMRNAGDNADLQSDENVLASSFTSINRPARRLLTPQSSTFNPSLNPRQEPFRYEPTPPLLPTPLIPRQGHKRGLKQQDQGVAADNDTKPQKQKRTTHGGHATKPLFQKPTQGNVSITPAPFKAGVGASKYNFSASTHSHVPTDPTRGKNVSSWQSTQTQLKPNVASGLPSSPLARHSTHNSSRTVSSATASAGVDLDGEAARLEFEDFKSPDLMTDDDIDDIFDMIEANDAADAGETDYQVLINVENPQRHTTGLCADYEDGFMNDELFAATQPSIHHSSSSRKPTSNRQSSISFHQRKSEPEPCGIEDNAPRCVRKFMSPLAEKSVNIPAKSLASSEKLRMPIVRPPFPAPVRDRSPIIGLSPKLSLRTCFRIGEAINQASQAAKSGRKVMFELYAKVLTSKRDETKQEFVFRDLFHEKPPYMKGVYDAIIWKSVQLYSYDSERLLEAQRICRCIGTIKRHGKEWVMTVFNAWEARWEDIAWVEGIIKV